ncbi:hypothetical protein K1T71_011051 [Dendrolimus kikuchii]|uniref:Uncharacterized protein n=1 Tax=Dendrolimus kikuchii TaxID=765133 RepID=A0ACC1CMR7_9NEOP|nr:hypothetical protein K1T71_011051 [Dendrolimus kikuchii]
MAVNPISLELEYEKNPNISREDIKVFRDWLMTQPHLPGKFITDLDLILAYHCCDRSLAVAQSVLDLHYTQRSLHSFLNERVVDRNIEMCLNTVLFALLPEYDVDGNNVLYVRLNDPDPKKFVFFDSVKTFMMIFDLYQCGAGTCLGGRLIIDMDAATFSHVTKIEITTLKHILYFIQECMLIKINGVNFLNAPYFMDKVMMLIRPFLKKALLDIINIHPVGDTSIFDIVPKRLFPKECGGEFMDFKSNTAYVIHRLKSNSAFFDEEAKKRVQESLRPGEKGVTADIYSIQGSFKKLDID